MKIGIIVHSYTGNTYSVAQKLGEKLLSAGHTVDFQRIAPVGGEQTNVKDVTQIRFETIVDIDKYDTLVFGGPVRGASISPVLQAYLAQISSLQGKKVACLVTEFFPFAWMGGNRAIAQMKEISESKGAVVSETGIVNWKSIHREKKIEEVVEKLVLGIQ